MRLVRDFFIFCLAFVLCGAWVFSGWPQIWHNPRIPPGIRSAEASHTTTFVFGSDAESWAYTDDNASCSGAFTSGAGNLAGSLETTGSKGGGAQTCNTYWEWSGTWEDLGVTAGHEVTGVSGAYEYAVSNDSSNGTWDTGAFELRDSGGTLRETLVAALTGQTGTAGFTNRSGTEQTFTAEASSATVRLRLNTVIAFGGGTRSWTGQNDNIAVTITHAEPGGTVSITVDDGTVAYGSLAEGATQDTFTLGAADRQIVTNTGDVTILLNIQGAATSDPDAWDLVAAAGTDEFRHRYASDDAGNVWVALTDSYQLLTENIAAGATAPLDLEIQVPISTSATSTQTHTITVQAVQQ